MIIINKTMTKQELEKDLTNMYLHHINNYLLKKGVLLKSDYEKIKQKIDEL